MIRRGARAGAAVAAAAALLLGAVSCSSSGGGGEASGGGDRSGGGRTAPPRPSTAHAAPTTPSDGGSGGTGTSPAAPPATSPGAPRWQPKPGTPWQWQLSGTVDTTVDVPVYDIDGFENTRAVVAGLHGKGRKVICYVNAGAWESFRPDAKAFPAALLGRGDGWDGERWLDIRQVARLRPLMATRFDMCREKGFDAVEPDLLDGYTNTTGFPLTAAQQLAYNRMIAALAHERGLAVGLKNDVDQVGDLLADFDFSVDEQCAQYSECAQLEPFITAGKPVFHVEYALKPARFCPRTRRLGFSSMAKHLSLDAWREPC